MADYGATAEVASFVPRYINKLGEFDGNSRPTATEVALWLTQVSAILNGILSQYGFTVPVTNTTAKPMLDMFVNQEVAAICEGVNGSGRFGPTNKQPSGNRFSMILEDVKSFVEGVQYGLELIIGSRKSITDGVGYRDTDETGTATFPIFQREAFGNLFTDWDSDANE